MREYLGITHEGLTHVFERSWSLYGADVSDVGLCIDAQHAMKTKAGNYPLRDYVPTCLECVAKEARVRSRY